MSRQLLSALINRIAAASGLTRLPQKSSCMTWGIATADPPMERPEMDWKRLVQFALLGSGDLEQYAILLIRVSIGLFFAISGGNKLLVAGGTKPVYETLVKAKVPFPRQTAYFVAGVEFVGGSLMTVGLLSSPACAALLIDMIVATLTSAISTLPKGLSPLSWLDDFLYLPEVLYVLFFFWLICSGPGKFSVDYWLAGQLQS
jgi:putative oxidoreductase